MITAHTRSNLTAVDLELVVSVLSAGNPARRSQWLERLHRKGPDVLLDNPELAECLLANPALDAPSANLLIYVLVRRHLLDAGIGSSDLADYLATMILEFGAGVRSRRIADGDERETGYLVDLLALAANSNDAERFRIQAHLGNYALWLAGIFPDRIAARRVRGGGPDLDYYDHVGRGGFAAASDSRHARRHGLQPVLALAAARFPAIRESFNRMSDRYFFPSFSSQARLVRDLERPL